MNTYAASRERGALLLQWEQEGCTLAEMRQRAHQRGWSTYTKERIRQSIARERRRRQEWDPQP